MADPDASANPLIAGLGADLVPRPCTLVIAADAEAAARIAAERLVHACRASIVARGRFTVALAGGATPRAAYAILADEPARYPIDWSRVEVFWGDERAVAADDSASNYRAARTALLDRVPLDPARVHRIEAEAGAAVAARRYEATLAEAFHTPLGGPPPRLDFLLLGLGDDGHTASLFPHTDLLTPTDRWVLASRAPVAPHERITMTPVLLNRAREVAFLVTGAAKGAILAEVLEGPRDPMRLPAQLIQPETAVTWIVDADAATALSSR